ncbi:Glycosyltransferase involved in cell wall bisynthesis [Micromonospora nigra]|uniref:Glycosyltransferase involved in cell wall bisynthesis n=1 Tax=Micromonospora nigra TaxID=145857 RepID=A0A1C6SHT0_9ACTN|nr:glycosyltransferase family 4 protein [Micromonospora nigra]SCL29054.1 Glycosyltransferase involved in cell wall bisynthesis [Micromonospora nigra]
MNDTEPATAERPLRILAVTNLWPENGGYRGIFVHRQVTALRALGHHVDVEVVAQSRGRADYVLAAPRVRRRARTGRYDIVHVHYGMTAPAARLAGHPARVLSLYGSDVNEPRQRRITRLGWGGTRARIYVSRRLAEAAGDPAGHVVANGVDFALFRPADRAAARASLGIAPTDRVVLFGADPARPVKGYDLFTEVVGEVRRQGLPVRELVLSAPGQPEADLVRKYDAADLLLFTSRPGSEGSPTVVKEATAMGLPVVSVDVGDVAEVLDGVRPGAVVRFPDGPSHGEARTRLVRDLAGRVADVLAAGTRADGRDRNAWLDESRVARRITEIYRTVLRS